MNSNPVAHDVHICEQIERKGTPHLALLVLSDASWSSHCKQRAMELTFALKFLYFKEILSSGKGEMGNLNSNE